MNIITIPKNMTHGEELVIIPRREYEIFLRSEKVKKSPTDLALEEGLRDIRAGRTTPPFTGVKEFKRFLKRR